MTDDVLKHIWPEWSIVKRIGSGAYGTIYEVIRNEYGVESRAAVKVISIPASEAEIDALRSEGLDMKAVKAHFQAIVNDFVNEIRLMVSLEGCPNIVNVKDYKVTEKDGTFGWNIFILMELLTPFAVHTHSRPMTEAEVIKLGCDICTALETCAEEKIIHRDIKPGNILVHKSGDFKLGDFGIARKLENMTGGLSQRYTPKYMAPEVATSMCYDERVDIYSLGIVLYELLNDRRIPFQPNKQITSLADVENAVRRRNSGEALPAPCNASPAMADVILRACAFDPNLRFSSATHMKQALMCVANGTYQTPAADALDKTTSVRKAPAASAQESGSSVHHFGPAPKKNRKPIAVIASVLAAIMLFGIGFFIAVKTGDPSSEDGSNSPQDPAPVIENVADTSKTEPAQTDHMTSDSESTVPADSTVPAESTAPAETTVPGESTVPAESTPPVESAAPAESTPPVESAAPAESTPVIPAETEAPTVLQPIKSVSDSAIIGASASSFLSQPEYDIYHSADRVLDGQLDTAWVEGSSSHGIGDSLTIQLDGDYSVSGLTIFAGYHKDDSLYVKNSRPQEIQIAFSDGSYFSSILYDTMQAQTIRFDQPVVTSSVTIGIVSVYEGSAYEDTAITEVSLF